MNRLSIFLVIGVAVATIPLASAANEPAPTASNSAPANASGDNRVYGEWRIRVRPDKMNEYAQLIEAKGLPLFCAAGGRMVGWWTTLVGDLYEHITLWEYDDMAAFAAAVEKLGGDKCFAEFVALRDPLLAGEENRFLRLATGGRRAALPEPSKLVVHEVQRVPLARRDAYLKYMESEGLKLLERNGFRPAGPWIVTVGNWSEVTYLFRFDSLSEREKLIAHFGGQPDAQKYSGKINEFATEVTTRILLPAKFAHPAEAKQP